jgi:hypothetical protein
VREFGERDPDAIVDVYVGGDLDRRRAVREGAGEERPRSTGIAALRDKDVNDLPVLIDRAVEVGPAASDLRVGLIDEPPVTGRVPSMTGRVDELRREGLHIRSVVDFPEPLGPRNPVTNPGCTSKVSPPTATVSPYFLTRPRASIIGNHCPR